MPILTRSAHPSVAWIALALSLFLLALSGCQALNASTDPQMSGYRPSVTPDPRPLPSFSQQK